MTVSIFGRAHALNENCGFVATPSTGSIGRTLASLRGGAKFLTRCKGRPRRWGSCAGGGRGRRAGGGGGGQGSLAAVALVDGEHGARIRRGGEGWGWGEGEEKRATARTHGLKLW